ncbi:hypothetical protein [Cohaesibacter marisflavi]|uniref:hypothetical protein n=1 Tax=Cohaesibacter marisflavi TaxID=655353 RepID=UPI0029C7813B|nr:hypothetical protein [Cohaesibacter marisflavi]
MNHTTHIEIRMNQRGINKDMIHLAMDYGECKGDKQVLSRSACRDRIIELKRQVKQLEHAEKKGGITVVTVGDQLITAYRTNSFSPKKSHK